jgi:hypothetical protein
MSFPVGSPYIAAKGLNFYYTINHVETKIMKSWKIKQYTLSGSRKENVHLHEYIQHELKLSLPFFLSILKENEKPRVDINIRGN